MSNMPAAVDTFQDPTPSQLTSSATVHSQQHSKANDGLLAVEQIVVGSLVVNAKGEGALGNGAQDDTAFITAAIAACIANGGGTVFLPYGNYKITSQIVITDARVNFIGAGPIATTITPTSAVTGSAIVYRPSVFVSYPAISGVVGGFTVDGVNTTGAAKGFEFGDVSGLCIRDLYVRRYTGTGAMGIWVNNTTNWTERTTWENVQVEACANCIVFDVNGGTNSFARQRMLSISITPQASGYGVVAQNAASVYHSVINLAGNAVTNVTCLSITGTASIQATAFHVGIECGETGVVPINVAAGGALSGTGIFDFDFGAQSPSASVLSGTVQLPGAWWQQYTANPNILTGSAAGTYGATNSTVTTSPSLGIGTWQVTLSCTVYNPSGSIGSPEGFINNGTGTGTFLGQRSTQLQVPVNAAESFTLTCIIVVSSPGTFIWEALDAFGGTTLVNDANTASNGHSQASQWICVRLA